MFRSDCCLVINVWYVVKSNECRSGKTALTLVDVLWQNISFVSLCAVTRDRGVTGWGNRGPPWLFVLMSYNFSRFFSNENT
jgi:hypothetical protein